MNPHAHMRSLPPGPLKGPFVALGAPTHLETALRRVA